MGLQEIVFVQSLVDSLKQGLVALLEAVDLIPQVNEVLVVFVEDMEPLQVCHLTNCSEL
jgi:hypothetical protein